MRSLTKNSAVTRPQIPARAPASASTAVTKPTATEMVAPPFGLTPAAPTVMKHRREPVKTGSHRQLQRSALGAREPDMDHIAVIFHTAHSAQLAGQRPWRACGSRYTTQKA